MSLYSKDDNYKRRRDDKDFCSGEITKTSRIIIYGTIGMLVYILSADSDFFRVILSKYIWLIVSATAIALFGAVADYTQYISGYFSAQRSMEKVQDHSVDTTYFFYRLRIASFWAKQLCALVAALVVILVFLLSLAH